MYLVTIYTGGIYKFKEFKEFVEDLGGLVLKRDSFHISRGDYFLSEEIHVLTIIPIKEEQNTLKMAKQIKGRLETPEIDSENEKKILACLPIHSILSKSQSWMSKSEIEKKLECPCNSVICGEKEENCFVNYLDEVLEGMSQMEMIRERKTEQGVEYKIIIED